MSELFMLVAWATPNTVVRACGHLEVDENTTADKDTALILMPHKFTCTACATRDMDEWEDRYYQDLLESVSG